MRADHMAESYRNGQVPSAIGPYRVIKKLGAGGMGEVYLARSAEGVLVAVKQIRADFAADSVYRSRFRREVGAARAVSGTCTPAVVGADPDDECPWLASVFVDGPDLHTLVSGDVGPLDEPGLRDLATALATALDSIHRARLVHRDLKPRNILMTGAGPQVIDFGIAKPLAMGFTQLTDPAKTLGTPAYMSPEQAKGEPVSPASDIFSLGSVLIFAATGHPPFRGDGAAAMHAVAYEPPELDGVPSSLRPLVKACMDKSPEHRPTPEDLLSLLAETGTFSLRQRATPPMGRAYLALSLALACYFCAFLVTMAIRHGSGFLAVPALAFGMFSSLFVITKLHGLRWINVQATVDGWGLRLRYGDTRVEHPWEELKRVELVRPAVAQVPVSAPWSLVAVMRPGHRGTQPKPLRLRPGNRVGLNLHLTPKEAAALAALLARQRENSRRASDNTADDGAQ